MIEIITTVHPIHFDSKVFNANDSLLIFTTIKVTTHTQEDIGANFNEERDTEDIFVVVTLPDEVTYIYS